MIVKSAMAYPHSNPDLIMQDDQVPVSYFTESLSHHKHQEFKGAQMQKFVS